MIEPHRGRILIVDDEQPNLDSLEKILLREGYFVRTAVSGASALTCLSQEGADVVLTDLRMAGMDGLMLLSEIARRFRETEVILITAYGSVEVAVEAMKQGAYDFLTKPVRRADVVRVVSRAMEKHNLLAENRRLREELAGRRHANPLVGSSPAMRRVLDLIDQVAPSTATVLITGPSGTGKELVAHRIHQQSVRSRRPFIKLNCAALPETLLESELFGYEEGAFTGATRSKAGRFELADGGTLLLDEIGDLPLAIQPKLLRVLQDGEFERLGSTKTTRVDVRLLASTNLDIDAATKSGRFREDLFYRLNVIRIDLPSLASRRDDIPLLAQHFVRLYAAKNNKLIDGLSPDALSILMNYPWPGNVRELENAIERAIVLTHSRQLTAGDFPELLNQSETGAPLLTFPIGTSLAEIERRTIDETMRFYRGDKAKVASVLGIATRTVYRKLSDSDEDFDKMSSP